jgi:hypothetical protein
MWFRLTALTGADWVPRTLSTVVSDGATTEPSLGGGVPTVALYQKVRSLVLVLK